MICIVSLVMARSIVSSLGLLYNRGLVSVYLSGITKVTGWPVLRIYSEMNTLYLCEYSSVQFTKWDLAVRFRSWNDMIFFRHDRD